ncbi:XTP/dITP diphosphatase [Falsibacillus pallidus]|uniref:XTP/dITP diphosphatase n=1 Tax=Falsibacillus pallidus TaxID=493781 RepID=UPI003D9A08AD
MSASNTIIIATKNKGKAKEFVQMFAPYGVEVKTLLDFPDAPDIEETGSTFAENAILKAEGISQTMNTIAIADDSGLAIDALNGRPGIYSARYAGEQKDDEANMDKVLAELIDVPGEDRSARFHCALAVAIPGKETVTVEGTCEGSILLERTGTNGFGYDPIFFVKEKGVAMAELSPEEKNQISHRANALKKLSGMIGQLIEGDAE